MSTPDQSRDDEFRKACAIVERHARAIGKDCQIIFTVNGVEVAPLSWAGSDFAETLFEALTLAAKTADGL